MDAPTLMPTQIRELVELACRAPSVHNTQPWRWCTDGQVLHLYADRSRQLQATDPEGRDLLLELRCSPAPSGGGLGRLRVAGPDPADAHSDRRRPSGHGDVPAVRPRARRPRDARGTEAPSDRPTAPEHLAGPGRASREHGGARRPGRGAGASRHLGAVAHPVDRSDVQGGAGAERRRQATCGSWRAGSATRPRTACPGRAFRCSRTLPTSRTRTSSRSPGSRREACSSPRRRTRRTSVPLSSCSPPSPTTRPRSCGPGRR